MAVVVLPSETIAAVPLFGVESAEHGTEMTRHAFMKMVKILLSLIVSHKKTYIISEDKCSEGLFCNQKKRDIYK